ncbi:hypothetical protein D3C76_1063100 [compost metagenome]
MVLAVDGDDRCRAGGRGGDGVEVVVIQVQAAEAAVVTTEILHGAVAVLERQAAETILEPGGKISAAL